ncbi:uncharacterized protein LOC112486396 [Cynoglossus semilaevis]|uniref:uncharacterized protein LOC112486396 n=1 Tax=Cynoglossus semilaevis TaxID=244447 RepID=UPI000D6260A4|nr:uncharacterized protein LOC112486396 [Cynoglossus semilaevis]
MTTLLSQPHLTVIRCTTLNPATLLPTSQDDEPHNFLDCSLTTYSPRPDLSDQPVPDSLWLFTDGSSVKDTFGVTCTTYAVTTLTSVLLSDTLPSSYSAQAAELKAMYMAFHYASGFPVTIYTDSKYVFNACRTHTAMWHLCDFSTSSGSPVKHAHLLKDLCHALSLPSALAIVHCPAHTVKTDLVSLGNALADCTARAIATGQHVTDVALNLLSTHQVDNSVLLQHQSLMQPTTDMTKSENGILFHTPSGKPVLPPSLYSWAAHVSHGQCHVTTTGMIGVVQVFYCSNFSKSCTEACTTVHNMFKT